MSALDIIFPKWRKSFCINKIDVSFIDKFYNTIKKNFSSVVDGDLTVPIKYFKVDLHLREEAVPIFSKSRPVPFALKGPVEEMLRQMVGAKILAPVEDSPWASPIVIVKKRNEILRLCIDPKRSLNPQIDEDHYKTTPIDDLLVEVGGHRFYSTLDLTGAFQQLELSPASQRLVTINTHVGLFSFLRLPFGVKTATAVFQRVTDKILIKYPWARAYVDDIIVTAESLKQMQERLLLLFSALKQHGVKVNLDKCKFFQSEVTYLGHVLSVRGIAPTPERVKQILDAKPPENVKQLQSFLGMVTYCLKFIPRQGDLLKPLHELLGKGVSFVWDGSCQ